MMKKKTYLSPEVATAVIVVDSPMLETSPTTIPLPKIQERVMAVTLPPVITTRGNNSTVVEA